MFRRLPACPEVPGEALAALAESMRATTPTPSGWGPTTPPTEDENDHLPAGYTYFGQFVDHDITFDPASDLQKQNDPDALVNFRSPRFDLDSVYGSGPDDEPFQYQRGRNQAMLAPPNGGGVIDLPRNVEGTALIGDPRNDENVIVCQLQLVFLQLHNKFLDQVQAEGLITEPRRQFDEAKRRTRWHYQWVIVHDYLRRLIGNDLHDQLYEVDHNGVAEVHRPHYRPKSSAYMPVEFSVAAYRFGHSLVRDRYAINARTERPLFVPGDSNDPSADLRGQRELTDDLLLDWSFFLPVDEHAPQMTKLIDTRLSPSLFDLPGRSAGEVQSLPLLNLQRGQSMGLPSGQDVAKFLGNPVLSSTELRGPEQAPVPEPTPLWYYLLREAEIHGEGGKRLGPTGGRIVGEVLLGLLEQDPTSFYILDRPWQPTIPAADPAGLQLGDLVRFAQA